MTITKKWVPLLLFNCLFVGTANVWAYPVKWTLHHFIFSDGGAAEGSFILDGYTGFSDIDITTSTSSSHDGASYSTTFGLFDPYYRDFAPSGGVAEGSPVLSIGWYPNALGSEAGMVDVYFSEGNCAGLTMDHGSAYCGSFSPSRAGLSGAHLIGVPQEVDVPEPDIVILMGLGLVGIAFARMSRKRNKRKGSMPG